MWVDQRRRLQGMPRTFAPQISLRRLPQSDETDSNTPFNQHTKFHPFVKKQGVFPLPSCGLAGLKLGQAQVAQRDLDKALRLDLSSQKQIEEPRTRIYFPSYGGFRVQAAHDELAQSIFRNTTNPSTAVRTALTRKRRTP